jgi:hypothetical protein
VDQALVPASFVPQGQFDPIPQTKLVINGPQIVLDDVLCRSDGYCHFAVFQSLGDEFDDSPFPFAGDSPSTALPSDHSCLRYKSVASFTRLMPFLIPKRKKSRLKWALTVRRAMFSCLAISELSQPCRSRSAICCSRGPSRTGLSSMPVTPRSRFRFAAKLIAPDAARKKSRPSVPSPSSRRKNAKFWLVAVFGCTHYASTAFCGRALGAFSISSDRCVQASGRWKSGCFLLLSL